MEKTYVSEEGYQKLVSDLEYLKTKRRREIAQQLDQARSHGDLRENAEYEAAKHALQMNEIRISELEMKISGAVIVNMDSVSTDKVIIGTKVLLWDFDFEEEIEYSITGTEEADPAAGKISVNSPVATALLGHKVGDIIEAQAPRGTMKFEIKKIST
ncbi:Transcription elongation factor GreA [Chitinispirillum alkaliphilum]|nr:Transcription elongation factor GreA [Chitinispirillum alkaliphilum]